LRSRLWLSNAGQEAAHPSIHDGATHQAWARAQRNEKGERPKLEKFEAFEAGHRFQVGDIEVRPFTIPHDAADPVGLRFAPRASRLGSPPNLGYLPVSVRDHLRGCDVLVMESNHDLEMLRVGPYPWSVKQRVMSRVGHLSNLALADFFTNDYDNSATFVVLAHLSQEKQPSGNSRGERRKRLWPRAVGCFRIACSWRRRPRRWSRFGCSRLRNGHVVGLRNWLHDLLPTMSQQCIDPIVGKILAGWRYDISGLAPEMCGDYEGHFAGCEHCRSRQQIHRMIDVGLIALASLSAGVFLLAFGVIWHLGPAACVLA